MTLLIKFKLFSRILKINSESILKATKAIIFRNVFQEGCEIPRRIKLLRSLDNTICDSCQVSVVKHTHSKPFFMKPVKNLPSQTSWAKVILRQLSGIYCRLYFNRSTCESIKDLFQPKLSFKWQPSRFYRL